MSWSGPSSPSFKINRGPLENGAEAAWFDFSSTEIPSDLRTDLGLQVVVFESSVPLLKTWDIREVLDALYTHVRFRIFEGWFKPLFS